MKFLKYSSFILIICLCMVGESQAFIGSIESSWTRILVAMKWFMTAMKTGSIVVGVLSVMAYGYALMSSNERIVTMIKKNFLRIIIAVAIINGAARLLQYFSIDGGGDDEQNAISGIFGD